MNERILRVAEFNKIAERLIQKAETTLGKELARKVHPASDIETVTHQLEETDEAYRIIGLNKSIPFGGIADIRASLQRSKIGSVLSAAECLDVAETIRGGRNVKTFLEALDDEVPLLLELSERIMPLRDLEQTIKNAIDDNAHVMDSASEKLRSIRSSIRTNENRIRERMDNFLKTKSSMLSDAIITIRNDRYVLPVKSEYRSAIGGIVHDQSSSGQTLFMEPRAVVDLNNNLQEAFAKESQEVERILSELTEKIAEHAGYLKENTRVLAQLDFIAARAKLSADMRAAKPKMNDQGYINMKEARHPLIPETQVVPNDIELGKDYTAIVITGPNTGGKTVTLKLVGLSILMAQSGIFVPAQDGLELAVFNEVFADIGDEQSIEQNLSTFSSHMTNIVSILEQFDDNSLILFDELGAGTDPQEGAALAMSILDKVIDSGARVLATTHYPELKAYGFNRPQVMNASVEFNVETLQPTYRLLLGVPGRSNAFEISKRLGLDVRIIDKARGMIGVESESVENMIASLETARRQAEKDYEEAHQILEQSEHIRRELQAEWRKYEKKRDHLYEQAEEKAAKALADAREEAEMIVDEIKSMRSNAVLKEHEWIEAKKMLEEAQPHLRKKTTKGQNASQGNKPAQTDELHPGDEVRLIMLNQKGVVAEKVNKKEYMVQVGAMKVKVKGKDLEFIKSQQQEPETPVTRTKGTTSYVKPEIDLRGERYEDALLRVEKYIDEAVLAGFPRVTIIHGKGTGALRKGVQDFVKTHPNVASARAGERGEGDTGVTVLELK
ncbi:endonuclease MutS2 [Aciduricibacillus chroicocephali]|uniref:Endonuclease MutS2 n=1 Tax=Aciduricibacillus chroicocephali TaxID=3054939 RepID=A0ABY9KT72_9BACI|nr:endonuclease MutS2 [Bacillaceae bacterium 44XB]